MTKTRTKVVVINGAPQSGKDTFVDLATKYCDMDESANVLNLSSVDIIKGALASFGWDGEKTDEVRNIISAIKKIWISAQNGPTMFLMNNILKFHEEYVGEDNIVFCHIREPEEIGKLEDIMRGMNVVGIDFMTLLIIRVKDAIDTDNLSDSDNPTKIMEYPYDEVIYNDSDLATYDDKVCKFIDKILS